MNWDQLLCSERRRPKSPPSKDHHEKPEARTEFEKDYDRILFSTPLRRLADKTQVFPLEINDSVRTRLTHSIEVSNLARSIGLNLAFNGKTFSETTSNFRNIPAILGATGLAHDLGNPPFGHEGENSIRHWFEENNDVLTDTELTDAMRDDFLNFEGNAQTIRLLTRLQLLNDDYGLNLTYGTLAALMKYTVPSNKAEGKKSDHAGRRKPGFFVSEAEIVKEIWRKTGLSQGTRHPLAYVMEASDDIAYSVIDAEDAVKKGLASYQDVVAFLLQTLSEDPMTTNVLKYSDRKFREFRNASLSPGELNDLTMQLFRTAAIAHTITEVTNVFVENTESLLDGTFEDTLIGISSAKPLIEGLKNFGFSHAYKHRSVLEIELLGHNVINGLMDMLWREITERECIEELHSKRKSPFTSYVYSRISENYRRVFENGGTDLPIRYREVQLLTDMISGMTDSFAIALYEDLKKYERTERRR